MSEHNLSFRNVSALLIVPLTALLACASGGAKNPNSANVVVTGDSLTVADADGLTMESLLAGRFPGVEVKAAPGGGVSIRIRGGSNSFSSSEEPLYVVDDVPLQPGAGGIVFLSPYDIAKIEVLKNPADVGIYGVRGGNGVIKITTKKPGRH